MAGIMNTSQMQYMMQGALNKMNSLHTTRKHQQKLTQMKMMQTGNTNLTWNTMMNLRNAEEYFSLTLPRKLQSHKNQAHKASKNEIPTPSSSLEAIFIVSWAPETNLETQPNLVTVQGSKPHRQILNKFRYGRFTMITKQNRKAR